MTRFPIEPHFVYSQGSASLNLPSWTAQHAGTVNASGNIYNETSFPANVFLPAIQLPALGNTHTHRRGNRITVTTIRVKIHLALQTKWCSVWQTLPFGTRFTDLEHCTPPVKRFFKFRFMVVQFNDELHVDADEVGKWFYSTYCWFKDNDYTYHQANYLNQPISVHSNILRLTTPYTGKFNILMDRPFTLVSTRPQQLIDVNIPLNKSYVFDEDDPTKLLFPNIWMFILPPLNSEADLDPLTASTLNKYWYQDDEPAEEQQPLEIGMANVDWFAKLNFVDL